MATRKTKPANGQLDATLGARIRELRRTLGLTQAQLGARVDLTYQQVQKYESGANRVSALMLIRLAEALESKPGELLRSVEQAPPPASPAETERLLEAFARISAPETRAALLRIVLNLADAPAE